MPAGHSIARRMHGFTRQKDPGASGTIRVVKNPCIVELISATTETRTLSNPSRSGVNLTIAMRSDGGDVTLTVTNGYDEEANTTIVFNDVGQYAAFTSYYDGTNYRWRLLASNALGGGVLQAEALTVLTTLTHSDTGKTFYLGTAGGFAVTLPAPTLGWNATFIVKVAPSGGSYTVVTAGAPDQILSGHIVCSEDVAGDFEAAATATTITFVDAKAIIGDRCRVDCDGTSYHATGSCSVTAAITITG